MDIGRPYIAVGHVREQGFLEIIERLSVDHARAIAFIYRCSQEAPRDGEVRRVSTVVEIAGELQVSQSHAEAWCERLAGFGLIRDASVGTWDYASGKYGITNYGREFAQFLGDAWQDDRS